MKARRIIIDYAALTDWIKEHVKDAPQDVTVFALRESFMDRPEDDGEPIPCGEVVLLSDSFTYVPDGSAPVVWRATVKRCAGCLSS